MPLLTLQQKESIILPFDIDSKKRIIAYRIEATQDVKVFIMNNEGIQKLTEGIGLDYIFKSNRNKYHKK